VSGKENCIEKMPPRYLQASKNAAILSFERKIFKITQQYRQINVTLHNFKINDMEARIQIKKWGNDLGINIPRTIANGLSLSEGHYVRVQENGNRIIIETSRLDVSYNLSDMLNEITQNNIHHSIETGIPVGKEIW
jgi:antitoxin MazE